MSKPGFLEHNGKVYIRCHRCGEFIPQDKLASHLRIERHKGNPLAEGGRRPRMIRRICEERGIRKVVHFTRITSLASILREGLLPRATLEKRSRKAKRTFLPVDPERYDKRTKTISISISFPNYQMFYKYRQQSSNESWVVLSLEPSLLWELKCSFCPENAASAKMRDESSFALGRAQSLWEMFAEEIFRDNSVIHRSQLFIPPHFPTDPQAEVLVHEPILPKYISEVAFVNPEQRGQWVQENGRHWPDLSLSVQPGFFRRRPGEWPGGSTSAEGSGPMVNRGQ